MKTLNNKQNNFFLTSKIACFSICVLFLFSCGGKPVPEKNTSEKKETKETKETVKKTATPEKKKLSEFDEELLAMRNADFDYIFTLRRKDEKVFDQDDKDFVKGNSHFATNRFTLSDDKKIIFIGSNYKFSDEHLKALKKRFEFEDFSKPEEQIEEERKKRQEENEEKENKKEEDTEKQQSNVNS